MVEGAVLPNFGGHTPAVAGLLAVVAVSLVLEYYRSRVRGT
ncbi:hypothetical protein [Haloarchaeobius sp. HRN-SO-5]